MNSELQLYWSHTSGYVAGFEWTVRLSAGGHTQTIPRPSSSVEAEWIGVAVSKNVYIVSITGDGTPNAFTFSTNGVASGTNYDIKEYHLGNLEIGSLRLRFYATSGFEIGQRWIITSSRDGVVTIAEDSSTLPYGTSKELEVLYAGTVLSSPEGSLFHVVIDSSSDGTGGGATFKYSRNGTSFSSGIAGSGQTSNDILASSS